MRWRGPRKSGGSGGSSGRPGADDLPDLRDPHDRPDRPDRPDPSRRSSDVLRFWRNTAREINEHRESNRREKDRNELRRREHSDAPSFVASEKLDDESRERVEQHVEPEGSA